MTPGFSAWFGSTPSWPKAIGRRPHPASYYQAPGRVVTRLDVAG